MAVFLLQDRSLTLQLKGVSKIQRRFGELTLHSHSQLNDRRQHHIHHHIHKHSELSTMCDVITTSIEHVHTNTLIELEQSGHCVHPNGKTIQVIQVRYSQIIILNNHAQ